MKGTKDTKEKLVCKLFVLFVVFLELARLIEVVLRSSP